MRYYNCVILLQEIFVLHERNPQNCRIHLKEEVIKSKLKMMVINDKLDKIAMI